MFAYFKDLSSAESVKKQYTALCKKYHPDVSGADTTAIMQEINAEFPQALKYAKSHSAKSESSAEASETVNVEDLAADFMEIINKIIHLNGVEIELIGSWIWLSGNTYAHKERIKAAGFRWSKSKKMWYWRREEERGRITRREMTIDEIRLTFGSQSFKSVRQKQLA